MTAPASFFESIGTRDLVIGCSIIGVPIAVLGFLATLGEKQPFDQNLVMGCYVANEAPSLDVRPEGIRIGESRVLSLSYFAKSAKDSYVLSVTPALRLEPTESGQYAFVRARGIGYLWTLLPKDSDNPRRMRAPSQFGGRFSVIAANGEKIVYTRVAPSAQCP